VILKKNIVSLSRLKKIAQRVLQFSLFKSKKMNF